MAPAPQQGQILVGPMFSEPVRIATVAASGPQRWQLGLVGTATSMFRQMNLTDDDLVQLTTLSSAPSYTGDPARLRLGLQAHALGIAFELDPCFGLSISRVDPLPHQLEAVRPQALLAGAP
jgi:hypothetical protein